MDAKYRIISRSSSEGIVRYYPQKRCMIFFWTSLLGDWDTAPHSRVNAMELIKKDTFIPKREVEYIKGDEL